MAVVILLMIIGGVGLTIAISDQDEVTLRWLRLGGLISLGLLGVVAVMAWRVEGKPSVSFWGDIAVLFLVYLFQVMQVHHGDRNAQRVAAAVGFVVSLEVICATFVQPGFVSWVSVKGGQAIEWPYAYSVLVKGYIPWEILLMFALSSAIFGGFLMTMFLGHAYLTAGGEMTQDPFVRLVRWLAFLLLFRLAVSLGMGLWPYVKSGEVEPGRNFNLIMIAARYLVGMAIPLVLTYMVHDCVKRHSNQSATGILYVAVVVLVIGEGLALWLLSSTGMVF